MAEKNAPQDDFVVVSEGSAEPETKIQFDSINDTFTGIYLGMRKLDNVDGSYQQARFQNGDVTYFTNANYSLRDGLKSVRTGSTVRITFVDELDTGQASPMKCFRVEVARRSPMSRHST